MSAATVKSFFGTFIALFLALSWARFCPPALYWYLGLGRANKFSLSNQSLRDLAFWKRLCLTNEGKQGRAVKKFKHQVAMHPDAATMGYEEHNI